MGRTINNLAARLNLQAQCRALLQLNAEGSSLHSFPSRNTVQSVLMAKCTCCFKPTSTCCIQQLLGQQVNWQRPQTTAVTKAVHSTPEWPQDIRASRPELQAKLGTRTARELSTTRRPKGFAQMHFAP